MDHQVKINRNLIQKKIVLKRKQKTQPHKLREEPREPTRTKGDNKAYKVAIQLQAAQTNRITSSTKEAEKLKSVDGELQKKSCVEQ